MELLWDGTREALLLLLAADPEVLGIMGRSLLISGAAATVASVLGVPLGVLLHLGRFPGRGLLIVLVNVGMGLPPVLVGLVLTLLLWRSGPFGALSLLYTPGAMVLAQVLVALPLVAGFTQAALGLLNPDLHAALVVCGARQSRVGWELMRAARAQVLVAIAAGFGRAISEVGASLMVGGNLVGLTRVLTTATVLEVNRGEFARAMALGILLLLVALLVNLALGLSKRPSLPFGSPGLGGPLAAFG